MHPPAPARPTPSQVLCFLPPTSLPAVACTPATPCPDTRSSPTYAAPGSDSVARRPLTGSTFRPNVLRLWRVLRTRRASPPDHPDPTRNREPKRSQLCRTPATTPYPPGRLTACCICHAPHHRHLVTPHSPLSLPRPLHQHATPPSLALRASRWRLPTGPLSTTSPDRPRRTTYISDLTVLDRPLAFASLTLDRHSSSSDVSRPAATPQPTKRHPLTLAPNRSPPCLNIPHAPPLPTGSTPPPAFRLRGRASTFPRRSTARRSPRSYRSRTSLCGHS